MLLPFLAVITLHTYAATPQAAAIKAVDYGEKRALVIRRINLVGRYATVLTSGGRMEGALVTEPILVERFSFGWQPLAALYERCDLESLPSDKNVATRLMEGMPSPAKDNGPCIGLVKDAGPRAEVEAVRRLMPGPFVRYVVVSGNWAIGGWYGGGGGESLYWKREGSWQLFRTGGGAMGVDEMRKWGVPQADWCKFGIVYAKC
jgi:hypothetical protein